MKTIQLLKRGRKPEPILKDLLSLKVKEVIMLPVTEWPYRTTPYQLLYRHDRSKKFSIRLLASRTGWVITRKQ